MRYIWAALTICLLLLCSVYAGAQSTKLRLTLSPSIVVLSQGNGAIVTAQYIGENPGGRTVTFSSTRGTFVQQSAQTDANGLATTTLAVGQQDMGQAIVTATSGMDTAIAVLTITMYPTVVPDINTPNPMAPKAEFSAQPNSLPADGVSTADVIITLVDQLGNPVADESIQFSASMGSIERSAITDENGSAHVVFTAPETIGTATITAHYMTGLTATTKIALTPINAARIDVTADPATAPADGISQVRIVATVLDTRGTPLPGIFVNFTSSLGNFEQNVARTDQYGRATLMLTAPAQPGTSTVTASVSKTSANTQIVFEEGPGGPGLSIASWSMDIATFVNDTLVLHQVQFSQNGSQSELKQYLRVMNSDGTVASDMPLDAKTLLIRDQYGAVRGVAKVEDAGAKLMLLSPDGKLTNETALKLPAGVIFTQACFAHPQGNILFSVANPDGSGAATYLMTPKATAPISITGGVEAMAASSEGYFVVASANGGPFAMYTPNGNKLYEIARPSGFVAALLTIGPGGAWFAVSSPVGQTGRVLVYMGANSGNAPAGLSKPASQMVPAGKNQLVVSTTDQTLCLDLGSKKLLWSLSGGFDKFIESNGVGVLAGPHHPTTGITQPRVLLVRMTNGATIANEAVPGLQSVAALLPPEASGQVTMLASPYLLRFPLIPSR